MLIALFTVVHCEYGRKKCMLTNYEAYLTTTNKLPETEVRDKITKNIHRPLETDIGTQSKVMFKLLLVTTPLQHHSNIGRRYFWKIQIRL